MKLILPFLLSFILACLLGLAAEWVVPQLYQHAHQMAHGKPLPPITEWSFQYLAGWENGSMLCLFILPWVLLVLFAILSSRISDSTERSLRLLYGLLCFVISEAILASFFALSSLLPFVPHYGIISFPA